MNISALEKILLTLLLAGMAGSALAAPDAIVNVSGNITNQTCTVAGANVNQFITLPSVTTANMNADQVTFQFGISGCPSGITRVTATLSGARASSDMSGYGKDAVIANTGTATNVGIGFLGASSVGATPAGPLPVGTASATALLRSTIPGSSDTSGTLYLGAKIVPLVESKAPGAGTVAGTASVTFVYS